MLPPTLTPERPLSDIEDLARWQAWVARFAEMLGAPATAPPHLAPQPEALPGLRPAPGRRMHRRRAALALRREAGWRVTNVAVTLGSNKARRAERWAELEDACAVLGFGNIRLREDGFEEVKSDTAERQPALWPSRCRRWPGC